MDKIATQLEILRRVLAEIQDSSQDDLAQEVVPIVKKVDELDLENVEDMSESLVEIVEQFQAIFSGHNISKWSNKVLRKTKKKFKSPEERFEHELHELGHCISVLHILSLILSQHESVEMPTVLWVDDAHENNVKERERATISDGIDFALANSTAEALTWLEEHKEFKHANTGKFRIVTDWYRPDEKDEAASSLTKQVREAGCNAPILVYCSERTDPSALLSSQSHIVSSSSDHLLSFYWASMKLTSGATASKKGAKKATAAKKSSKASSSVSDTTVPSSMASKSKGKEEEVAASKLETNLPKPSKAKSAAATAPKKKEVAVEEVVVEAKEEEEEEHMATLEVKETHEAESTPRIVEEPAGSLSKHPTDVMPPTSAPAKSNIHDILASRIPKASADEAETNADGEVEIVAPTKPLSKQNSKKSSSVSASAKSGKKSSAKQLFDDDEDDDEEYVADDGEKMDVDDDDFRISDDGEEEFETSALKKKKKSSASAASSASSVKSKKSATKQSLSRQPTDIIDDPLSNANAEDLPSTPPKISAAASTAKAKKDWNSFLMSRVPTNLPPASPLSVLDESTESANAHLLATPPPKAKASKAKKASTSVGLSPPSSNSVATPPMMKSSSTPVETTPNVSPIEKPRPPKPSAPMGPTPARSLSALDDEDDDGDDDGALPLFTKAPEVPLGSSSNLSDNVVLPAKSVLLGLTPNLPVGQLSSVLLEGRNKNGMRVTMGGANATCVFRTGGNAHEFEGYVDDHKDGSYTIEFFPTRIATYRVIVQIDGQHIQGSPFSVNITAPLTSKKRSSAAITSTFSSSQSKNNSFSPFDLDEEDELDMMPQSKKPKRKESSLPELGEEDDDMIEPTQVV